MTTSVYILQKNQIIFKHNYFNPDKFIKITQWPNGVLFDFNRLNINFSNKNVSKYILINFNEIHLDSDIVFPYNEQTHDIIHSDRQVFFNNNEDINF